MLPFDFLCALVAASLGLRPVDPQLVAAAAKSDVAWPRLVTLSGVHLLTPALAPALEQEHLRMTVPAELRDYLAAMHEAATLRNDAPRAQLEDVGARLNSIGVVPVALKGAIRLIDGLWPDRALRFMHDLDLLVPEDALHDCAATLKACGWTRSTPGPGEAEHHLSLEHPDATARVELHRQPLAAPYAHLLTAQSMTVRASPLAAGNAVIAVPALDDQLVHLVAHGMLQHAFLENGRFLLRDLVEQRLLDVRAGRGELSAARARFAAAGYRLAWEVSQTLCERCLGGPTPEVGWKGRVLSWRMMLQQRSALAMQVCAPAGWVAARLLRVRSAEPPLITLREITARLAMFRRKTHW